LPSSINFRAWSICCRDSFGFGSAPDASRPCGLHAFAGALDNQTSLELSKGGEDMKNQCSSRCRRADFLRERPELNAALVEVLHHGDEVAQAAGQPVELPL